MEERSGLVILDHHQYLTMLAKSRIDPAALEALTKYRGIEADVWPDYLADTGYGDEEGLADIGELTDLTRVAGKLRPKRPDAELVHVQVKTRFEDSSRGVPSGFERLGIDYGYFNSKYSVFSAVLSDVELGQFSELTAFRSQLNEVLLFDDMATVRLFHSVRSRLADEGKNLERNEPLAPILIHAYADSVKSVASPRDI